MQKVFTSVFPRDIIGKRTAFRTDADSSLYFGQGRANMQNESSVNKKVLRYFENTNKQIVAYAGFLSLRVWFLISILLLVVIGNGLLMSVSMHADSSLNAPGKAESIPTNKGSATPKVENHATSKQQNASNASNVPVSLPHPSGVSAEQASPKDDGLCEKVSRCMRC